MSDRCVVRTYLEQDAIIHTSSDREVYARNIWNTPMLGFQRISAPLAS
jgi:hypothetical protein